VDQLVTARDEMISTLVAYDRAEFRLFVAIGQTPSAAIPDPHH
jgi:hypothetical protein